MGKVRTVLASNKMHSVVAQVITNAVSKLATIAVKRYTFRPADLTAVASHVKSQKIKVVLIQGKTNFRGGYVTSGFILLQPWGTAGNTVSHQGIIVHEAVHAAFDVRGQKAAFQMSSIDDEATAYIAQAMYLHRHGVTAAKFRSLKEPVRAARAPALEILRTGRPAPPAKMLTDLQQVVRKWYRDRVRRKDGV